MEGDPDFATSCYYIQWDHILFTKSRLILNTLLIKGHFGNSLSELLKISISTEAMRWNGIYNGKVLGSCWIGGTKDQFVSRDLLQLQPDHSNSVARCNKPVHTHESRISPWKVGCRSILNKTQWTMSMTLATIEELKRVVKEHGWFNQESVWFHQSTRLHEMSDSSIWSKLSDFW